MSIFGGWASIFGDTIAAMLAAQSGGTTAPPPAPAVGGEDERVNNAVGQATGMFGNFWGNRQPAGPSNADRWQQNVAASQRTGQSPYRYDFDDGSYWVAGDARGGGNEGGDGTPDMYYSRETTYREGENELGMRGTPMSWEELSTGKRAWEGNEGGWGELSAPVAPQLKGQLSPTEWWKEEQAALDALEGAFRLDHGLEPVFMSDPDNFVVKGNHTYYKDMPLYTRELRRYGSNREPDSVNYLSTQQYDDTWKQLGEVRESDFEDSDFEKFMGTVVPAAVWAAPMIAAGIPGPGGLGATFGGGAAGAAAAGATIGGITGGIRGDNILESAALGGLAGGVPAAGAGISSLAGIPAWAGKAIAGVGAGMLGGADAEDALKNYAIGQGTGMLADYAAPYVSDFFDSFDSTDWLDGAMPAEGAGDLSFDGRTPAFSTPAQTLMGPDGTPMMSRPAMTTLSGEGVLPTTVQTGSLPLDWAAAQLNATDAKNRDALEAGDDLQALSDAEQAPTVTGEDLQKYAKAAKAVSDLLGGEPEDAPQRQEGQSEEAYQEQLVQYLGLDTETMAAAGLQPGTPEYMEYVLQQADAIIEQTLGDIEGVDPAELSARLRTKTAEEQMELQRALYVRGQLGTSVGSGTYTDPFSGRDEEVVGENFNPSVAAHQRGLARDVDALAGMSGEEGHQHLQGMLGRDADLFGMQAAQDARFEQAKREQIEDPRRRRRGMFGY